MPKGQLGRPGENVPVVGLDPVSESRFLVVTEPASKSLLR